MGAEEADGEDGVHWFTGEQCRGKIEQAVKASHWARRWLEDRKGGMWFARRVLERELESEEGVGGDLAGEREGDGGDESGTTIEEDEVKQEKNRNKEEDGAEGVRIKQEPTDDV